MSKRIFPSYLKLSPEAWQEKINFFAERLSPCRLCPRQCRAERRQGKTGFCRCAAETKIASFNLHHGEEPPISGLRGSGTVFFSGCTLKCVFCQNYPISQLDNGNYYSIEQLAGIYCHLQQQGAHNINWVSPTPHLAGAVAALRLAAQKGLVLPIVYNCSGYENKEIVSALNGIVDIYMPDFKYSDDELGLRLSGVHDYRENAEAAIAEMFAQTGTLHLDEQGTAVRGTLIRHLIIPGQVKNSLAVLRIISQSSFAHSYLSLMSQYFPAYRASKQPGIDRRLTPSEYRQVKEQALELGIENGWFQDI